MWANANDPEALRRLIAEIRIWEETVREAQSSLAISFAMASETWNDTHQRQMQEILARTNGQILQTAQDLAVKVPELERLAALAERYRDL